MSLFLIMCVLACVHSYLNAQHLDKNTTGTFNFDDHDFNIKVFVSSLYLCLIKSHSVALDILTVWVKTWLKMVLMV